MDGQPPHFHGHRQRLPGRFVKSGLAGFADHEVVVMELVQDAQNARQVRQALKLVAPLPVVWPTAADCQRALTDFIAYHLSHNLGLLDALIAACATGLSATLCTFNVKHYRVVPGLAMVQP